MTNIRCPKCTGITGWSGNAPDSYARVNPCTCLPLNYDMNVDMEKLLIYIDSVVDYVEANDWEILYEQLQNGAQPYETAAWSALMINRMLYGHDHPKDCLEKNLRGLKVTEDGHITNYREYFKYE